jgi:uncharacterized small protein (TIGR04563 family)
MQKERRINQMAIGDDISGGSNSSGSGYSKNGKKLGRPVGSKNNYAGLGLGDFNESSTQNKASIYLPAAIREEMETEGARLDRSTSYIVKLAWKVAREQIRAMQGVPENDEE